MTPDELARVLETYLLFRLGRRVVYPDTELVSRAVAEALALLAREGGMELGQAVETLRQYLEYRRGTLVVMQERGVVNEALRVVVEALDGVPDGPGALVESPHLGVAVAEG